MTLKRGAPGTTGRRSPGAIEVKIRLSAAEAKALDRARGRKTRPGYVTDLLLEDLGDE